MLIKNGNKLILCEGKADIKVVREPMKTENRNKGCDCDSRCYRSPKSCFTLHM